MHLPLLLFFYLRSILVVLAPRDASSYRAPDIVEITQTINLLFAVLLDSSSLRPARQCPRPARHRHPTLSPPPPPRPPPLFPSAFRRLPRRLGVADGDSPGVFERPSEGGESCWRWVGVAGGGWELLTVGERKEGGSEGDVSEGGVSEGVGASGELGKWKICRLGRITGLD